jgi:hypothetical protein
LLQTKLGKQEGLLGSLLREEHSVAALLQKIPGQQEEVRPESLQKVHH